MTTLRIGRLASRYRLPPGSELPGAVQARLDRVARGQLVDACEALATAVPEISSDEVWLVCDLRVDLRIDVSATDRPATVARAWSHTLMASLRTQLARGHGEQVMWFPSRAEWTAAFVAELAHGTAWDRWYLRAFSSLRPMPLGRAITEALVREPEAALDALAKLSGDGDLEIVLLTLGPKDARRVIDAVVPALAPGAAPAGRDSADAYAALAVALRSPGDPHLPGAVLRLVAVAGARGLAPPPGAERVAAAVIWLADLARSASDPGQLAAALAGGRWAEALRAANRSPRLATGDMLAAFEVLRTLAAGDGLWLTRLARETAGAGTGAGPLEEDVAVASRFGGLLLAWPVFCEHWPEAAGDGRHRLLVASLLLGAERREALLHDPVLALLCGLERPPAPEALTAATVSLPRELEPEAFCALVLHRFAAKLPGFADSSPDHLRRNFLEVTATLRLGEDGWHARVTGPPLQVVLRMAGMSTVCFTLPWSPHAEVTTELAWS